MKNRLEKFNFAHVVKDAKSVVGFSASANFELDGMSHKHDQVAKYSLKTVASYVKFWAFFRDEFLQDGRHFRG